MRSSAVLNLIGVGLGLALGGLGIGWHGRPSDAALVGAIRVHSREYPRAAITLDRVQRNWVHEIFDSSASEFLVTATIAPTDQPRVTRCFLMESGFAGTVIPLGAVAPWRCDYPF